MQRFLGAAMVAAITAFAVGSVQAGEVLDRVKSTGVLRVATDPAYPPQSSQKPDGTFEGFDIDVATELAKRLGAKVE